MIPNPIHHEKKIYFHKKERFFEFLPPRLRSILPPQPPVPPHPTLLPEAHRRTRGIFTRNFFPFIPGFGTRSAINVEKKRRRG